jgi:hypothetical protein
MKIIHIVITIGILIGMSLYFIFANPNAQRNSRKCDEHKFWNYIHDEL